MHVVLWRVRLRLCMWINGTPITTRARTSPIHMQVTCQNPGSQPVLASAAALASGSVLFKKHQAEFGKGERVTFTCTG